MIKIFQNAAIKMHSVGSLVIVTPHVIRVAPRLKGKQIPSHIVFATRNRTKSGFPTLIFGCLIAVTPHLHDATSSPWVTALNRVLSNKHTIFFVPGWVGDFVLHPGVDFRVNSIR